ncbi:BPSL0761 family protein [Halomonas sp. DQ26W]|uniref:BPSL0761 family protein n=1 Tax=Halomonas sp. DQ26W TaxID=2282311 RepID=UPI002867E534|nr:BPSL0761 family protein [Halomonas sp. DQ26W]
MDALHRDLSLPEAIRQEAWRLLRHYPSQEEILMAGKLEESAGEGTLLLPVFSSAIDEKPLEPTQEDGAIAVWRAAIDLFGGDRTAADRWLHHEAMGLGWKRPIDVMQDDPQQVLDLIGRIDHGVYT